MIYFGLIKMAQKYHHLLMKMGFYAGTSKVEKADAGFCIVYQNIDGKSTIVSGAKRLLNLDDFLKSYQNQEY